MTTRMQARRSATVLAATLALLMVTPLGAAAQSDPRQGLAPGTDSNASGTGNAYTEANADAGTAAHNIDLLANRPKPRWTNPAGQDLAAGAFSQSNINSDLAFTGDYAISGNYRGFGIYDISDPNSPALVTTVNCVGSQGDVSVYGNLLFMSVESAAAKIDCTTAPPANATTRFRGVRIFDISDIHNPQHVGGIQTCRGSHTHTVVSDPNDSSVVYVYNSGTAGQRSSAEFVHTPDGFVSGRCGMTSAAGPNPSQWMVEVIRVPLDDPSAAAVVNESRLFRNPDTGAVNGLQNGPTQPQHPCATDASPDFFCSPAGSNYSPSPNTNTCHDITSFSELGIAAGACQGNGILIDISDPANPTRLDAVADPNFSYWHSATLSNDGNKVIFTDEWGGGGGARCMPNHRTEWGGNAIFDIVQTDDGPRMEFGSYFKVPGVQTTREVCVAHNGNLVPVPGRDVMVQAWYEGGLSVFDFTDSGSPVELAFFDRGPYGAAPFNPLGGYWSVYWYNGNIYGNEIFLGFDSFELLADGDAFTENELAAARTVAFDEHNAQEQRLIEWAPSFALARAGLDQLVRAGGIHPSLETKVRSALDAAEQSLSNPPRRPAGLARLNQAVILLRAQADIIGKAQGKVHEGDADGLRALAQTIEDLRNAS